MTTQVQCEPTADLALVVECLKYFWCCVLQTELSGISYTLALCSL